MKIDEWMITTSVLLQTVTAMTVCVRHRELVPSGFVSQQKDVYCFYACIHPQNESKSWT